MTAVERFHKIPRGKFSLNLLWIIPSFEAFHQYIVINLIPDDSHAESCGVQIPAESNHKNWGLSLVHHGGYAILRQGKDWLAQYQDNITEWQMGSWCREHGLPGGKHYKSAMNTHCHWFSRYDLRCCKDIKRRSHVKVDILFLAKENGEFPMNLCKIRLYNFTGNRSPFVGQRIILYTKLTLLQNHYVYYCN